MILRLLSISVGFNGWFSRDNLPKMKDGAYVINHDSKQSKRTHRISLVIDKNTAVYFDSFWVIDCSRQNQRHIHHTKHI